MICVSLLAGRNPDKLRQFIYSFIIFSSWVASEALYSTVIRNALVYDTLGTSSRIDVSRILGMGILLLIIYTFEMDDLRLRLLGLIGVGIHAAVLLISGTRAPLLAVTFSSVVVVCMYAYLGNVQITDFRRGTIFSAILSLLFIPLALKNYGFRLRTVERFAILWNDEYPESLLTRIEFVRAGLNGWSKDPIIGSGIGSYSTILRNSSERLYPHNLLIEVLSETGLIGLILIAMMLYISTLGSLRLSLHKVHPVAVFIFSIMLYWLLNSMITGDISHNRYLFIFFGMINIGAYRQR
jgi:O-antigen ligase